MRICVFCGSSAGHNPVYANAARGMEPVYGGGRVGLMGVLADPALDSGRKSKRQSGSTPASLCQIELAPLTRDAVWPLARGRSETASR